MKIESAKELAVYNLSFQLAMEIFELTKTFPADERYAPDESDLPVLSSDLSQSPRSVGQAALRSPFH